MKIVDALSPTIFCFVLDLVLAIVYNIYVEILYSILEIVSEKYVSKRGGKPCLR